MRHAFSCLQIRVRLVLAASIASAFLFIPLNPAAAHTFRVLHSFCSRSYCLDGQTPKYPPISDSNGVLYGTTAFGGGGSGVVYSLTPNGTGYDFKVLYSFIATPGSPLIVDTKGNLYGTTVVGGAYNKGAFFELKHNADRTVWTEVVRYSFCPSNSSPCPDGQYPSGPMTYPGAESGAPYDGVSPIYGVTPNGGTGNGGNGAGVSFRITPVSGHTTWKEKILYNFCSQTGCTDGSGPSGGLIIDSHEHLFGTTLNGGSGPSFFEESCTASRRTGRQIARPQNAILFADEAEDLLLVGPMISRGDHIYPHVEKLIGNRPRQAEATGGVLTVRDDEIEHEAIA